MNRTEQKFRRCRAQVVVQYPFFGALLLQQTVEASTDVETMATNGKVMRFNPEWVEGADVADVRFACAHNAMAPALMHHLRRGDRDSELWNQASDYAVNPILQQAGMTLPDGALYRPDLANKSAELIYALLDQEQPPSSGSDQHQGDQPDQGGQGDEGEPQPGDQGDGNGADQAPPAPDYGGCGCVEDADFETEDERQQQEREARVALNQAATLAAGKTPGEIRRMLDAELNPKAPWRELLRRYMDNFAKLDYSWRRPNRRFVASGLYLPSMHSEQLGPIAYVIDASASMPDQALLQATSELQAIVDELQPEFVDVIIHDTHVRQVARFEPGDRIFAAADAGGGTKFAPVAEYLNQSPEPYAVAVWFTDLEASDWGRCPEPLCPVLFLDWTGYNASKARFGEVVGLEEVACY